MGLARGFVRYSPQILVVFFVVVAIFCVAAIQQNGFWIGLQLTLGLLTGVETPMGRVDQVPAGLFRFGAWLTVVSGWLVIPAIVALLLGFGEKEIAEDEDLRFELFKFATKRGLRGQARETFVKTQMERRNEWQ